MLKITGVILCIAGCSGYGILKIFSWRKAIEELEQWIMLFQKMKRHICYQRDLLEDICCQMNQELYGICGVYTAKIGELSHQERYKGFADIWKEQMSEWKTKTWLPKKLADNIIQFPDYTGEQDCELQISFLDLFISNLIREKEILEKQIQEKQKPVMVVSLISGMVISILLL